MAEYQKAPKPPPGRRIVDAVKNHAGTTVGAIIAGIVVLVVGVVVFDQGGSGSDGLATVAENGNQSVSQTAPPPESAVEEAAQRPFWAAAPTTFESAEDYTPNMAEIDYGRTDLLVGLPKEIFEEPDEFEAKTFFVFGASPVRLLLVRSRSTAASYD